MDLNKIINGLQIQLAVYMDAYVKSDSGKKAIAGIYYFTIDNPMIDGDRLETSVEEAVFNTYMLDGYSINDSAVIEKIDREIIDSKRSNIINVSLKKDGDYTVSSRVLNQEQIKGLMKMTRKKVTETAERIISGDISIEPAKINDTVPCRYCDFMSFCQFDSTLPENNYNSIKKINKNDLLNLLAEEGSRND